MAPVDQSPTKPGDAEKPELPTIKEDAWWEKAENEWGGFTLIRAENVKGNHTVEVVTPRVEREKDGIKMVVCKHIAK